jgi:hypothetical protein
VAVEKKPDISLARRTLPGAMLSALEHIFADGSEDVMLVGGTALAGFYAGHRRSDDLDLFVRDEVTFDDVRRRVRSLTQLGVELRQPRASPQFSRVLAVLDGHRFTVDVVLDENLFRVGGARAADGIHVASLRTLLMCKAATLVSRCSEKDLYDLWWLCSQDPEIGPEELVRLGSKIDGGANAEAMLISLTGARLSVSACDFALPEGPDAATIHERIAAFKDQLETAFGDYLENLPAPPLAESLRQLKRLK